MNNQMLIKNLAKGLTPWKPIDSLPVFFMKWLILSLFFFVINALWMPWRLDFHLVATNSAFLLENSLWIVLLVTSALALHVSAFPENDTKKYSITSLITFIALILLSFKNHQAPFAEQLVPEMDLWRGRCGFIITFFAILETPFLVMWAKRGAPKSAGMSGAYAALTSASLGCLLMQVICDHHNSLHLILWHFIPLALMSFGGFLVAKKVLRW